MHVLGSFMFGGPSDRADTFAATTALARKASLTFAQFVMMTPLPGTVDFERWEIPIARYWLIPASVRPKMFSPHETMSTDEIRERTQGETIRLKPMPELAMPVFTKTPALASIRY